MGDWLGEVHGTGGSISWDWGRMAHTPAGGERSETEYAPGECDMFAREVSHFLECVRTGERPRATAADGLRAQELIDAAYRSAAELIAVRL